MNVSERTKEGISRYISPDKIFLIAPNPHYSLDHVNSYQWRKSERKEKEKERSIPLIYEKYILWFAYSSIVPKSSYPSGSFHHSRTPYHDTSYSQSTLDGEDN